MSSPSTASVDSLSAVAPAAPVLAAPVGSAVTAADIVLTGDRPTGRLHLGHYAGSLQSRLALQGRCAQTIVVADLQALTDNAGRPAHVAAHVREVVSDYLAVGLDPAQTTIALQSRLPALAELTMLYLNLVTVARLERNPTVRAEIEMRGFARDIPAGFLCYPVSQAADITAFRATVVPVGEDQLPMIELSNEIVRRVNRTTGTEVLPECRAMLSDTPRLPGIDGRKASKSLGNAISLSATTAEVRELVMAMYTDPAHARVSDPGQVEGNVVFAYLDAFDPATEEVADLKQHYARGGLGDVTLKRRLIEVLHNMLEPIRERRLMLTAQSDLVDDVLADGTRTARLRTEAVLHDVRQAFSLTS
ncbi:MAG TPA: tryptophan--tRNA ligase [Gemmatimonas aurantiaca]|uniref:Tryptophan--tRNA ligase n=2 Tax=Gemmatimonas aurantiaca TaxID=173480 RepID=C1ABX9_GEMAT|nr:tryptophan--tRNA ligase [Gemmatimonas aurantiaca]BAH40006.1 tryptophanyl-tRNA synthetase [Gemmatimonas aurantiaca T-27]HCT57986.1 tryptophan--tRNA ligase [Gemmatimonas aurantiaca]